MKKECTRVQLEDQWVLHAKHHSSHLHIIMIIATEKKGQGYCHHHHHGTILIIFLIITMTMINQWSTNVYHDDLCDREKRAAAALS